MTPELVLGPKASRCASISKKAHTLVPGLHWRIQILLPGHEANAARCVILITANGEYSLAIHVSWHTVEPHTESIR